MSPLTLAEVLAAAEDDDAIEEPAMDWLFDHHIPLLSHSRRSICLQAWNAGWRPTTADLNT